MPMIQYLAGIWRIVNIEHIICVLYSHESNGTPLYFMLSTVESKNNIDHWEISILLGVATIMSAYNKSLGCWM